MKYLVSVIMPCYNSGSTIARAINSVLEQTYKHWELLIVDDYSSDNTIQIIENYLGDSRIQLFKQKSNYGAGVSRNLAIKNSKGRFIAFCDSDDYWFKTKLQLHIEFMLKNKLALSYTDYYILQSPHKPMKKVKSLPFVNFNQMLKNNYIGCLTAIYDTRTLGKVYMSPIRKRQDWILWLEILKKTKKAIGLTIPLSVYDASNVSLSSNKLKLVKETWYVYNVHLNYSMIKSTYLFSRFMYYYVLNKKFRNKNG